MRLAVTADDRSGAMEVASGCADRGWSAAVVAWDGPALEASVVVTDLRSRHAIAAAAAQRVRASTPPAGARVAHKVDSTLRGNWVEELLVYGEHGFRVVLVPAYPAAGRTCSSGLVYVDGIVLTDTEFVSDHRAPARTARPSEPLGAVEVADADSLARWLAGRGPWAAVADAVSDADIIGLTKVLASWTRPGVVLAGTAGVITEFAGHLRPGSAPAHRVAAHRVLVVCGSRHPASRAQAAQVEAVEGVSVLWAPEEPQIDASAVAMHLAQRAHTLVRDERPDVVVLLGGETADAFIGRRPVRVHPSLGVGVAIGTVDVDGRDQVVITKPGGFGGANLLADLLAHARGRS